MGGDRKTILGSGCTNIVEDGVIRIEGHTGPIFTDFAEETVLNGIPFGSARRVMANG